MSRSLLILALMAATPVAAQVITFKNGKTVAGSNVKRSGDTVLSSMDIGTGHGTVSYAISSIARIDFPEPPPYVQANALVADGDAAAAIAKIDPVISAQAPFRSIPGNWWEQAARIKLVALASLRRDAEAAALEKDLLAHSEQPETKQTAELVHALLLARKGDAEKSLEIVRPLLKKTFSKDLRAAAWVCIGDNELELKNHTAALRAYLHIPIFFPKQALWMPSALLGSARSYEALEDYDHARESLVQLQESYASSPEAKLAVADLKRIDHKLKTQKSVTSN